MNAAKMTGAFSNGTPTIDTLNDMSDRLVESGMAMMNAGIVPSNDQLAAMGWTPEQYWIYKMANWIYGNAYSEAQLPSLEPGVTGVILILSL